MQMFNVFFISPTEISHLFSHACMVLFNHFGRFNKTLLAAVSWGTKCMKVVTFRIEIGGLVVSEGMRLGAD